MVSSGPSAAFFDLDRTLISGSSAFILGDVGALGRAGADPPVRPRRRVGAGVQAARVERPHHRRGARPHPRRGERDAPGRPHRAQRRGAAEAAGQDPPRGPAAARPPPPRRSQHLHRVGGAGRDRRAAGPLARHDRRASARAASVDGRCLQRRARRPVLLRAGQGRRRCRRSPAGTASTWRSATPTATRRATCRCSRPSATRWPSTPTAELARHARRHGWPIVHFSQRTKSVIRRSVTAAGATAIAGVSFAAGTRYAARRMRRRARGCVLSFRSARWADLRTNGGPDRFGPRPQRAWVVRSSVGPEARRRQPQRGNCAE